MLEVNRTREVQSRFEGLIAQGVQIRRSSPQTFFQPDGVFSGALTGPDDEVVFVLIYVILERDKECPPRWWPCTAAGGTSSAVKRSFVQHGTAARRRSERLGGSIVPEMD